jgi:predicted amidohydrolase
MRVNPLNRCITIAVIILLQSTALGGQSAAAKRADHPSIKDLVADLVPIRYIQQNPTRPQQQFVRFGQCQIAFDLNLQENGTYVAKDPSLQMKKIRLCLHTATDSHVNVLVMPELAIALPLEERERAIFEVKEFSNRNQALVIAGSYYDEKRFSRMFIVGPGLEVEGYKIRPSRFEASPLANKGMLPGPELTVVESEFGRLAVITCVDLISDDIQFTLRKLADLEAIDALININENPASLEFLIEANSIVRRHPIFASITNVVKPAQCLQVDSGACYGHTSVLSDLRTSKTDAPDNVEGALKLLPANLLMENGDRQIAFDHVVGDVGIQREAMLVYELNMRLRREPISTNAPDQGYPPIRNLAVVPLVSEEGSDTRP